MSIQVDRATHATLTGQVSGVPSIAGWVLTLEGQGGDAAFLKSSADASQLEILDPDARTYAVHLTPTDTADAGDLYVELRALDTDGLHHVLVRKLIEVLP
jgi:hypothetical protein